MPKNVSDVVMGMLSDAGSATRTTAHTTQQQPGLPEPHVSLPKPRPESVAASPAKPPAAAPASTAEAYGAPRTLRLRPEAAARLRAAWLDAKRDDVLLTAQDFASDLVVEALVSRRRRRTTSA